VEEEDAVKPLLAWPENFLGALLDILGEPERIDVAVFNPEVSPSKADLVFHPQYTNFTHYKDPVKSIDKKGLLEIYSEQLAENNPAHSLEKIVWSNFHGEKHLISATFLPTSFSAEIQYGDGQSKLLLEKLREAVLACREKPPCEIRVVFA
jgi:hypothetical protein